jgi:pSer/pThr/pTyr-binding forkhead associated (FHA) protein
LVVAGRVIDIPAGEAVVLGRDPAVSSLAGALSDWHGVSRRHASVTVRGGTVTIQDFDSTNGTWVDGERLGANAVVLDLPARFRLGQAAEVEVRAGGQAEAPTGGPAS